MTSGFLQLFRVPGRGGQFGPKKIIPHTRNLKVGNLRTKEFGKRAGWGGGGATSISVIV